MKIFYDRLNSQVLDIEDAETEIRELVLRGFTRGRSKASIDVELQKIIKNVLKKIKIPSLREATRRSLLQFAERQYNTLQVNFGASLAAFLMVVDYRNANASRRQTISRQAQRFAPTFDIKAPKGLQRDYYITELSKRVDKVLDELAGQQPLDPDGIEKRNSLRNKAEMEIRYQRHQDDLAEMKAKGGLWICSTHADCSDRCAKWQGRIYSMNGTSGTTADGKPFIPLEMATDHYYTTKAGRTWKNGLLGFNCRHTLRPYKVGMITPTVSKAEQKREYDLTIRQRRYENDIRKLKVEEVTNKTANPQKSAEAKKRWQELYKKYVAFSQQNKRAYYPQRTKIE